MKKVLLRKLLVTIALGTVILIWVIDWLSAHTETTMSHLSVEHQRELVEYGKEADLIYRKEGELGLSNWLHEFQDKEKTWAAVVKSNIQPIAGSVIPQKYIDEFRIGRSVEWKIHLYFEYNPIMEVPFLDEKSHLLIQLPQRMRPGVYLTFVDILLKVALPFVVLCVVSLVLYRHVMVPLRKLEHATKAFSQGQFDVRVSKSFSNRSDELFNLSVTFDGMATRIGKLIYNQRELLSDLSHELRTPLTRMDMAIDTIENGINDSDTLTRLRYESNNMRALVEDTLTLAWLNNESPVLNTETFDLAELIQVICDDAAFEYSETRLNVELPNNAVIDKSSQQALGQAIENIIRNALKHTPENSGVVVTLKQNADVYMLSVLDFGDGVPESMLSDIFKPFFRVDKSHGLHVVGQKRGGFGLGLALAQRQITAVGGKIKAFNHLIADSAGIGGLQIDITLPKR
ncbi:MAG: histidine kinase sensor domain-containing protein [Pseudomonadota bacterium]|nr:histidine kinase sensor domain-containing protein [Pseudomonadota bacterium]